MVRPGILLPSQFGNQGTTARSGPNLSAQPCWWGWERGLARLDASGGGARIGESSSTVGRALDQRRPGLHLHIEIIKDHMGYYMISDPPS